MGWSECEYKELSEYINQNLDKRKFGNIVNEYLYKKNISTRELSENAGIDRKLISKFIADCNYHPSKDTALAVCIGLRLCSKEAGELLKISGYSFSSNSQRDLTVVYALDAGIFKVQEVNELLRNLGERLFKE